MKWYRIVDNGEGKFNVQSREFLFWRPETYVGYTLEECHIHIAEFKKHDVALKNKGKVVWQEPATQQEGEGL